MLCSLLKAFKVYFLSTALFQSSGTVYKDNKQKTVAVSYSLSSDIHSVNSSITAIYDLRYRNCFAPNVNERSYLLNTPDVSFRVKSWRKQRPTQHAPFFLRKPKLLHKKPTLTPYQLKQLSRLPVSKQLVIIKHKHKHKHNATHTVSNSSSASSSAHSSPNASPRASTRAPPPAPPSGTSPRASPHPTVGSVAR